MSSFQFTLTQIQGCRAGSRLDHSAGSLPVPEHGRSSTTKVKCDTSEARATLLSMCHHFHDKRVRAGVSGVMEHAYFEPLPREEWCDYCAGRRHVATLAPNLTAIYCISLQEQPHRTAKAATQFHALGLCRDVLFYRPVRGCDRVTSANPAATRAFTIRDGRAYSWTSAVGATSSSMVQEHASPKSWPYCFRRRIG